MNSWNAWQAARALGDEAALDDAPAPADTADAADTAEWSDEEPDYTFEGYSVEFLDKVALMPIVPKPPAATHEGA